MNTCLHFHPYCSFQCNFDAYVVCIFGSRKQSHLVLNLFLCITTLKYVLRLITPVERYGQDIHWFLNTDSGTRKKCLGFSGFGFCLFESFGFQQVLCLCFTGWSRCPRCQRSSWWPWSKGTSYSALQFTYAQVLGLSLLHVNPEINSRLSLMSPRKKHSEMPLEFGVSLFITIACPVCSLTKDIKFRMLLSQHKSSFFGIYKGTRQF